MASSSSSSQSWIYHVFLSFRGEDTRKTYVDHLHNALVSKGIHTYKDDEELSRGETIGPALFKAIEESQIAVIIFSENYANSSWCLDEVAYIMRCRRERGLIVMPIFYHVDPSDVRKQKGKYEEAFAKHDMDKNHKAEIWRKALTDAGNLAGWEPKNIDNGHESKGIKKIVDTILSTLSPTSSNVNENLVGIETRLQDLKSHIQFGSGGVRMVGIWGVGGGGKTTLASSIYNEHSREFDGCCFIENIREESSKYGLAKLQEKVLSGVLKQKGVEVGRVNEGISMIKDRLKHRKVLIVLDDVNRLDHLKALAGSHDWFGEGSRIIITTRDCHFLEVHKVNVIHNISLLNDEEGTELFYKHVPQDYRPRNDYELLSKELVSYAGGLPLALIVLGSFLCDKGINEWRSALDRLKKIPDSDIVEKLRISFDGLQQVEKELFLDIVCFFRGEKKVEAMDILDVCEFYPGIGLKVLIQKALITISDGRFDMHDLIQEMGHYIVRGKHPKNPEKHSRVWQVEDVENICAMDATTGFDKIEAIRIFSDMHDPLPRDNNHVVANMKNLRWVDWKGYHASSLPTNFPQRNLCCLTLSGGEQRLLWNGFKSLPNLQMIKLHGLKNLTMTPDFGGLPNLQRLMLYQCPLIEQIHHSIARLEKLVFLLIASCENLNMVPSISTIKKLETLSLSKCKKLSNTNKQVASYKQYIMSYLLTYNGLQFGSISLRKLILNNCDLGDEDIDWDTWNLPKLQELDLSYNKFSRLSFRCLQFPELKWLDVSSCTRLIELLELPSNIAVLRADYCYALETVGDMSKCKWLWKVSLMGQNKVGTSGDQKLIDSISRGNAIEHHFMSLALEHQIRPMSPPSQISGSKFMLQLPQNWYNEYSGFILHTVIDYQEPCVTIIIKQEIIDDRECNYQNELFPNPPPPPTYIGYVSFSSLKHVTWLNSECSMISFCVTGKFEVKLVPRKSEGDYYQVGTKNEESDCFEFWDDQEREDRKTFSVKQDSKSSINILWRPC